MPRPPAVAPRSMSSAPEGQKFDRYAADYESMHAKSIALSGESPVYFADYKVKCLQRLGIDRSAAVLDYGCGTGNLTTRLVGAFAEVHGYDPSLKSLEAARDRSPGATFHSEHAGIPDDHFRCAVLSGVLHHVPREQRVALMQTVRSKLAPGGCAFVFEHNPWNPLTRHAVATCPFDDDAVLLWPREAKQLLNAAGYARVRLDYVMFLPRFLAVFRPLEPLLHWVALGAQTMTLGFKEPAR